MALRSAIEQAFGTFVSANTTILNDEVVKDEIARLAGLPKHARLVGRVLSHLEPDSDIPWYRVINAQAKISLKQQDQYGQNIQQQKLMREGVVLRGERVDLKCYQWNGQVEI